MAPRGSQSSHICSAVAWADPGGKQTISTEGHPTLLADTPLEIKNTDKARKSHCQNVFSTSSVAKPNLMFVIYNPTGVAVATGSSDFMPGGENDSLA